MTNHYETETEKGLKHFHHAFILYIVTLLIMFVMLLFILVAVFSALDDPGSIELSNIFVGIAVVLLSVCSSFILILIALILFLIGIVHIYRGKDEFGPAHSESVTRGLLFLMIGFFLGLFGELGGSIIGNSVEVASDILIALGFLFLIYEISDRTGRNMLKLGAGLYIAISVAMAAVSFWMFANFFTGVGDMAGDFDLSETLNDIALGMMLTMGIGSLIWLPILVFILAYRRLYLRLQDDELKPVPPPYPYPQAPPPAYGYPPAPPYGYPPPPPPYGYPPPPPGHQEPPDRRT